MKCRHDIRYRKRMYTHGKKSRSFLWCSDCGRALFRYELKIEYQKERKKYGKG